MSERIEERDCGCRYVTEDDLGPGFVISSWTRLNPCAFHLKKYREDPRWTPPEDEDE